MDLEKLDLYHQNNALEEVILNGIVVDEVTGAYKDESDISDMVSSISEAIDARAFVIRRLEGMKADAKERVKEIQENINKIDKTIEALKPQMYRSLDLIGGKSQTANFRISMRKNPAIDIIDESQIPVEFMSTPKPPAPRPDKKKIRAAIDNGEYVPGAAKVENISLVMK